MTRESIVRTNEHRRLQKVVAVAAIALGLSACQNADGTPGYEIIPDLQSYTQPKNDTLCLNGGGRPCAVAIRVRPERNSAVINARANDTTVDWPKESYEGKQGDKVAVRCYTPDGEQLTSSENHLISNDWYQVFLPEDKAVNKEVAHPDSINIGGQRMYLGWASVTWFNQAEHARDVPKC